MRRVSDGYRLTDLRDGNTAIRHNIRALGEFSQDGSDRGPGFIRRGLNFFKAASRHVADGMQLLEEDQVEARLNVCRSCDHCDTD
ncbi:MAG: hypothetical protein RIK87_21680, partial [Fuerstiella sp.]